MPSIHEELPAVVKGYFELYDLYEGVGHTSEHDAQRLAHQIEGGELASHLGGEAIKYTRISGSKDSFAFEAETISGLRTHVFHIIEAHSQPAGPKLHIEVLEQSESGETIVEGAWLRKLRPYEKWALVFDLREATEDLTRIVDGLTSGDQSVESRGEIVSIGAKSTPNNIEDDNENLTSETQERLRLCLKSTGYEGKSATIVFNNPSVETLRDIKMLVTPDSIYWTEYVSAPVLTNGSGYEDIKFGYVDGVVDDVDKVIKEEEFVPGGQELADAFFDEMDAIAEYQAGMICSIDSSRNQTGA
ncbi:MAG TPA: hypothetical protein VLG27_04685 [Candidatus Saccharimonadia bacterium]|nr:hypothetical protein [Candidatus Saccharimonadia bacterium]